MPKPYSLAQQIEEVEREIRVRMHVYPSLVIGGDRTRDQIDCMRDVLRTLQWVQRHEAAIKIMIAEDEPRAATSA